MKTLQKITLATALFAPAFTWAGTINTQFEDFENYQDFSVYGLSEAKTLRIFEAELDSQLARLAEKYLGKDETLTLTFTNIDMAGDIQPWRNRHNADIRYVEDIYPPRLTFSYLLTDKDGATINEGEASITDLAYQMNPIASMRANSEHFFYEITLLKDWMRDTFRKLQAQSKDS